MFISAFLGNTLGIFRNPDSIQVFEEIEEAKESYNFYFTADGEIPDAILIYYRDPEYSEQVIDFFTGVCEITGSVETDYREIAEAILENAELFNVPAALAFALCWEESKFNPRAVNLYNPNGSIDRGLFQLNSYSFPALGASDVYDIRLNAYYGLNHFRFCLNTGGSIVSALAIYNAGAGRVRTAGAPFMTLNYINRILNNKSRLENYFYAWMDMEETSP